ncbi:MBL fold metallo-hydrolase, partial [candidate division KSB1 bacterium]
MGAKSMCCSIKTKDVNIIIDPGVSGMQPGFPASTGKKLLWLRKARKAIKTALKYADIVIVSHYHYDHYNVLNTKNLNGKILLIKNPNEFINYSQRERAVEFFKKLSLKFLGKPLKKVMEKPEVRNYSDPINKL